MCSVLPRDTLTPLDAGESQAFITVSFPDPAHQVELRSSGGAGEGHGSRLGVYQLLPEHRGQGGSAIYRQLHDTNDDQHYFLYRLDIVVAQPWRHSAIAMYITNDSKVSNIKSKSQQNVLTH